MNTLKTKSSSTGAIKSITMAAVLATTMMSGMLAAPAAALADNDRGKGYKKEHVASSAVHHRAHKKQHKHEHRKHKPVYDRHSHRSHGHNKQHKHNKYSSHHVHDKFGWHKHGGHGHRHDTRVIRSYHHHDHVYNHHHGYDPRISLGLHLGHFDLYFEDY